MAAVSLFAVHLASLFFSSGFTVAQISAPSCNSTISGWNWTINSLDQNPCLVAAHLMATCNAGSCVLGSSSMYPGPLANADDVYNLCMCSTVTYSLLSACSGCQVQGGSWHYWSKYAFNCTTTNLLSFPFPVPSGVAIPNWALLDVTVNNVWDSDQSLAAGGGNYLAFAPPPPVTVSHSRLTFIDTPEITFDKIISNSRTFDASVSSTSTAMSNSATSNTARPSPNKVHTSNVGGLVGGIVGGIVAISIIVSMLFFYRRRRQWALSTGDGVATSTLPETSTTQPVMKPYNPDDPATFPKYQGVSCSSHKPKYKANSKAQGYHGLPIL